MDEAIGNLLVLRLVDMGVVAALLALSAMALAVGQDGLWSLLPIAAAIILITTAMLLALPRLLRGTAGLGLRYGRLRGITAPLLQARR